MSRWYSRREIKVAYRIVGPKAGQGRFVYGVGGVGRGLPSGVWKTNTEKLGRSSIDGVEVEGERFTQVSSDQPSSVAIYERWYSDDLKSDCLATASGPGWKHTARIQILSRQEPDASLFAIPHDYTVLDLNFPAAS